ncbi:hypothetical protein SCLCIDRAFT_99119, partial [Scleroderma citrinum Foug A]
VDSMDVSAEFSPFQFHIGCSPHRLLYLSEQADDMADTFEATLLLSHIELDKLEVQDNLMAAKAQQAQAVNRHCVPDPKFKVGNRVMLSTKNRCH